MTHRRTAALLLALALSAGLLTACGAPGESAPSQPPGTPGTEISAPPEVSSSPAPPPVTEITATLAAAGDVMSHMPITEDAYVSATGSYDYGHILQAAADCVSRADFAIANLETPLAGGPAYSGYPNFNAPDALAEGLKEIGFDLVSTANNHTKDQGYDGIFRTLDVLDGIGLPHVGTYRSQEERDAGDGIYVADVGGISVAFLCYTYGLNGYTVSDGNAFCVNLFNLDYATGLSQPDYGLLCADLEAAEALETDLIAVMIHWGAEYQNAASRYQTDLAEYLVAHGADLIFGNHPHVLQPYGTVTAAAPDGTQREGFVCYSLGNFISNQNSDDATRNIAVKTTAVLTLELTKDLNTGETSVTSVTYTPFFMLHRNSAPAGDRRYLLDIYQAMEEYESGSSDLVDASAYRDLQAGLAHCHEILGTEGDPRCEAPAEPDGSPAG